jgi:hypothetical protein
MNRKLIALNVVLALTAIYAGVLFHGRWEAAKARQKALRTAKTRPATVDPMAPLPKEPPVLATGYAAVADKNLFHPSRDSRIPVELPPPPPPPPPMPALPKYHGTMNIGDGPMALLTMNANTPANAIKPGDMIGPFKLVEVNTVDITFEWNGQVVRRTLDDLTDRAIQSAPAAASSDGRSVSSVPQAVAAAVVKAPLGPGEVTSQGFRLCQPNDSMAIGTVQNGFRKVEYGTPFGPACRWDPVGGR